MKEINSTILSNRVVAKNVYQLNLRIEDLNYSHGQFAMLKIPSFFLRRPFGIAEYKNGVLTFFYKLVREGTKTLSTLVEGQNVNILLPLGNGFPDIRPDALIAGGYGLVPFYGMLKRYKEAGDRLSLYLGSDSKDSIFLLNELENISNLQLATMDGSVGKKCLVTELLKNQSFSGKTVFACGPTSMLKCLADWAKREGVNLFVSVESRMGCGWGACLGCAVPKVGGGYYHACKDGPVFDYKDLDWQNIKD